MIAIGISCRSAADRSVSPWSSSPPIRVSVTALDDLGLRGRRGDRTRAARLVLLGEPQQEGVQVRPVAIAEGGEEFVLVLLRNRAESSERAPAVGRETHELPAAVLRIARALDESSLLELVQQPD